MHELKEIKQAFDRTHFQWLWELCWSEQWHPQTYYIFIFTWLNTACYDFISVPQYPHSECVKMWGVKRESWSCWRTAANNATLRTTIFENWCERYLNVIGIWFHLWRNINWSPLNASLLIGLHLHTRSRFSWLILPPTHPSIPGKNSWYK